MEELVATEFESMLMKCPTCHRVTTFVQFDALREDEKGDIKSDTYHRCLLCLHLFRQVLEEVKDDN